MSGANPERLRISSHKVFFVSLAAVCLAVAACGRTYPDSSPEGSVRPVQTALLPSRGLPSGWSAGDSVQEYDGAGLSDLLDGGAELYREFGFVRSLTREYIGPEGALVIAGVYEMTDPAAAFGLFTVSRREDYQRVDYGLAGAESDYRLVFCKGSYFVDMQSMGPGPESQAAVRALGRSVESALPGTTGSLPAALSLLPSRDRLPDSETLVRGVLGLNTCHYLSDSNLYGLSAALPAVLAQYVSGDDPRSVWLLAVSYPDPAAASGALERVSAFYSQRAAADPSGHLAPEGAVALTYTSDQGEDRILLSGDKLYNLFDAPAGASAAMLKQLLAE
ncbi:hypothetical protein LLH00_18135 [bacterium]|nr:hypothetical protein [bacterium]